MNYEQSNTKAGIISVNSADDLSLRNGYLVKITDSDGAAAALPESVSDVCLYVIVDGNYAAALSAIQPLDSNQQVRIKASGAVTAGAPVVLADPATVANAGKISAVSSTAGTYFSPGIADESGVDGQLVLIRPFPRLITVS